MNGVKIMSCKVLTGKDLIKFIEENGLEEYDIYITTDGQWFPWCGDYSMGSRQSIALW